LREEVAVVQHGTTHPTVLVVVVLVVIELTLGSLLVGEILL
tara:strand:- start:296 stop:418 length:123 start_codon:yes stop_codon:yes gene_type:complete